MLQQRNMRTKADMDRIYLESKKCLSSLSLVGFLIISVCLLVQLLKYGLESFVTLMSAMIMAPITCITLLTIPLLIYFQCKPNHLSSNNNELEKGERQPKKNQKKSKWNLSFDDIAADSKTKNSHKSDLKYLNLKLVIDELVSICGTSYTVIKLTSAWMIGETIYATSRIAERIKTEYNEAKEQGLDRLSRIKRTSASSEPRLPESVKSSSNKNPIKRIISWTKRCSAPKNSTRILAHAPLTMAMKS